MKGTGKHLDRPMSGATNVDHRIRGPTFPWEQGGGNSLALNQGRCHHPMIRC